MRGSKFWFLAGAAIEYVLGTRAGREKYEQLSRAARRMWEHPTTQETAGMAREQATRLLHRGKETMNQFRSGRPSGMGGEERAHEMGKAGVETLTEERRPRPGAF